MVLLNLLPQQQNHQATIRLLIYTLGICSRKTIPVPQLDLGLD